MRYLKKLGFLVLALCMVLGMPLAASAAETPTAAGEHVFLLRLHTETDRGAPRAGTTRAQYVRILYDAAGAPEVEGNSSFFDVSTEAPYARALVWAEQRGIVSAGRDGGFDPDAVITTEEAADMLASALAALGETARQLAQGLIAAYTGCTKEEDFPALLSAAAERTPGDFLAAAHTSDCCEYEIAAPLSLPDNDSGAAAHLGIPAHFSVPQERVACSLSF